MTLDELHTLGCTTADGLARPMPWRTRLQRCRVRVDLLGPQFADSGYPIGLSVPRAWVEAFRDDQKAYLLSGSALRLHLDAGKGGEFEAEATRRMRPFHLASNFIIRVIVFGVHWLVAKLPA